MRGESLLAGLRQARRPPICVAGFPRSGTTWLSATLSSAPGVRAFHEPFNPRTVPRAVGFDFYCPPAGHRNADFDVLVTDAFAGRVEGPHIGKYLASRYRQFRWWPGRTMIKTVFGVLALERIAELSGAQVLVITRDALDVAASWYRLGWDPAPHVASLRRQRHLVADHLASFEAEMRADGDFWTQFGLLWGATHVVLRRTVARHPEWTLLDFRALCTDPIGTYRRLFAQLRLDWTPGHETQIRAASETTSDEPFRPERVALRQVGKWRDDGLDENGVQRLRDVLAAFEQAAPCTPSDPAAVA